MANRAFAWRGYELFNLRNKTAACFRRHNETILCRLAHQQPQPSSMGTTHTNPQLQAAPSSASSQPPPIPQAPVPPNKINPPQEALRVTVVSRYMEYVQSYTKILDQKFPSAMHVYRIFMVGIKEFYRDLKLYISIVRDVTFDPQALRQLSRKDLELYESMPRDMIRIAPFLLISALPFANYVVFPLAYKFPRQLLCKHFWTLQQRVEFALVSQRKRLLNQRAVLRGLQLQLDYVASHRNQNVHRMWSHVIARLGSGQHPRPEVVIQCLPLFRADPYHLDYLVPTHVNALLRLHGMHTLLRRRKRLADHACIIHEIDLAILREGGVENMTQDEMRSACFLRGLNPVNVRNEDMRLWLSQWVKISTQVDESSLSLLLHCPVLLAYNKPSNWALFHQPK